MFSRASTAAPAAMMTRQQVVILHPHLSTRTLVATCARPRPASDLAHPEQATKTALRRLARRHDYLTAEITEADTELRTLVAANAPELHELNGVGTEVAARDTMMSSSRRSGARPRYG